MQRTQVKMLMTADPIVISPETTLQEAARRMERADCGVLPVGEGDKLEGVITDRDIVVRAIAKGKDPTHEKVKDYMSKEVFSCQETDTLEQAADRMCTHQVTRLLVKDERGKITGILSFGAILRKDTNMEEISKVIQHATGRYAA